GRACLPPFGSSASPHLNRLRRGYAASSQQAVDMWIRSSCRPTNSGMKSPVCCCTRNPAVAHKPQRAYMARRARSSPAARPVRGVVLTTPTCARRGLRGGCRHGRWVVGSVGPWAPRVFGGLVPHAAASASAGECPFYSLHSVH